MLKIKSKQKIRIIRHFPENQGITIYCTFGKLRDTLDYQTAGAVEDALATIASDKFQYKGIAATFRGMDIQVNLID